jgi:hypothetical protein
MINRHEFARNLLAHGLDPSALNVALGEHIFVMMMREWETARRQGSGTPHFAVTRKTILIRISSRVLRKSNGVDRVGERRQFD